VSVASTRFRADESASSATMATKREPWDDDSDSDFQSAASFELDDSEDEARGGRVRDDDDEFVPEHEAFADEDFHECVDGLLLDEGYFGEDAYRGPPGAWADEASVAANLRWRGPHRRGGPGTRRDGARKRDGRRGREK
jgi:hypothetical protein